MEDFASVRSSSCSSGRREVRGKWKVEGVLRRELVEGVYCVRGSVSSFSTHLVRNVPRIPIL